jgi:hypothetical protein
LLYLDYFFFEGFWVDLLVVLLLVGVDLEGFRKDNELSVDDGILLVGDGLVVGIFVVLTDESPQNAVLIPDLLEDVALQHVDH